MNPYSPAYGLSLGQKFMRLGTIGVHYVPVPDAPNTYGALMEEYFSAAGEMRPMRVYSGGADSSVYGSPEANYAQRYVHDIIHAVNRWGFDVGGEVQTATRQRMVLGTLTDEESRVLLIDVAGQVLYHVMTGKFVEDQAAFCQRVYEDMLTIEECDPGSINENDIQIMTRAVRLYVGAFCYPNATRSQ